MIFTVVNVDVETVVNVDAESLRATREPHALPLRSLKPERAALTTDHEEKGKGLISEPGLSRYAN